MRAAGHSVVVVERNGERRDGCFVRNTGMIVPTVSSACRARRCGAGLKWMWNPASPFYVKPRLSTELACWASSSGAQPPPNARAVRHRSSSSSHWRAGAIYVTLAG